jgi:HEAT repeats/PBS lyase HEAT-like repeat
MDKRFFNLFNLTEDEAIALLDTAPDQLAEDDSRYVAAAHLVNFATERSIQALIRAVQNTDDSLNNRITRRKSVETLGRLQAVQALPVIWACLGDDDCYTVENAVWAIGEIGTEDPAILEAIAQLLDKPNQTYRVIIHTLAKFNYQPAIERECCRCCNLPLDRRHDVNPNRGGFTPTHKCLCTTIVHPRFNRHPLLSGHSPNCPMSGITRVSAAWDSSTRRKRHLGWQTHLC